MMPVVGVVSLFRDNRDDAIRIADERAKWVTNCKILHICIEGDSKDDTFALLKSINTLNTIVIKHDQKVPRYGSYVIPERLKALAELWNIGVEEALRAGCHYIWILDSDIKVNENIIGRLLRHNRDAIAPMLLWEGTHKFRDTWAYHKDNNNFTANPPYHKAYNPNTPFHVWGAGTPLIKSEILHKGVRFNDMEIRGFCDGINKLGYKIYVDPKSIIYHPVPE